MPSEDIDLTAVAVYVPVPGADFGALPGSALVGSREGRALVLDLEGNHYDTPGLRRYADRLHHAWGRHESRYPTVARRVVDPAQVLRVGCYDPREGQLLLDDELSKARLRDWLGIETIGEDELQAGGARFDERRALRAALADPRSAEQARWFIRHQGRQHRDLLD